MLTRSAYQGLWKRFLFSLVRTYIYNAIFRVRFAYTRDITSQAYARPDAKSLRANGGLPPGCWPCMIGLRVREIDEKREGGGNILTFDKKAIFTNKKTRSVCLSVCLSGYTFRHVLMSHADILDIDRGHIFWKHRHKNNKKVAVIYEKTVKNWPLLRFLQAGCYGARSFIAKF